MSNEIDKRQADKDELHAYIKQLTLEKAELEAGLSRHRQQLSNDIASLSRASRKAVRQINISLEAGIKDGLLQVDKLKEKTLKVGKEVGNLEARIESLSWVKPLISMVRAEDGLDDYQVRVIALTILRSMSSWLDENHGQDIKLYMLKSNISSAIGELKGWKV